MNKNISLAAAVNKNMRGADKIIASLTSQIAANSLKAGDRLPAEAKLCEEHSVSRTVVREAIQQLKAMGVIHTITGSGSYVTEGKLIGIQNSLQMYSSMTGDTDSWIELLEMRILLEAACVRKLASTHFSKKAVNAVQSVQDQMAQNKDNLVKFSQLDVKLHQTMIQASGNKIFSAFIMALEGMQLKFNKVTYLKEEASSHLNENVEETINRNFDEHKSIVDAIINRDPDAAEAAMKLHLNTTMKNLLHYIRKTL